MAMKDEQEVRDHTHPADVAHLSQTLCVSAFVSVRKETTKKTQKRHAKHNKDNNTLSFATQRCNTCPCPMMHCRLCFFKAPSVGARW